MLPVALDLGVSVVGEPGEEIELASDRFDADEGWRRYVAAVAAELGATAGFRGRIVSDLPAGAGLSSSAALEVAVALALCSADGRELERLELAELCRRAEERAVGVPCGLMDQASALLARAGHALLLDCGTREYRHVEFPADLELLVVDSGRRRRLHESAYAERRAEVEAGDPRRLRHVHSESERVLRGRRRPRKRRPGHAAAVAGGGPRKPPRRLRGVDARARLARGGRARGGSRRRAHDRRGLRRLDRGRGRPRRRRPHRARRRRRVPRLPTLGRRQVDPAGASGRGSDGRGARPAGVRPLRRADRNQAAPAGRRLRRGGRGRRALAAARRRPGGSRAAPDGRRAPARRERGRRARAPGRGPGPVTARLRRRRGGAEEAARAAAVHERGHDGEHRALRAGSAGRSTSAGADGPYSRVFFRKPAGEEVS